MQSALPNPVFLQTTPATLHSKHPPSSSSSSSSPAVSDTHTTEEKTDDHEEEALKRRSPDGWYIPHLLLVLHDRDGPGAEGTRRFLHSVEAQTLLREAVLGVARRLYDTPEKQSTTIENITLHLKQLSPGAVAFTTGSCTEKAIYLSCRYVTSISPLSRVGEEITGVIRHEMVHCWQNSGMETAPGGLIEGIADWVRLRDGFVPPHWKRGTEGGRWDAGYEQTAYFLDWMETRFGDGLVRRLNAALEEEYTEDMWGVLVGKGVEELWEEYCAEFETRGGGSSGGGGGRGCCAKEVPRGLEPGTMISPQLVAVYNAAPPPPTPTQRTLVVLESEADARGGVESIDDSGTDSSFDPWPMGGAAVLTEVMAKRLKNLEFSGDRDGKRFVKEFEALVGKVQPDISDEDKRLLLVTSFKGYDVNVWYEETDLDDDLPYATLVELLQEKFKGVSSRRMKIIERDAKLN